MMDVSNDTIRLVPAAFKGQERVGVSKQYSGSGVRIAARSRWTRGDDAWRIAKCEEAYEAGHPLSAARAFAGPDRCLARGRFSLRRSAGDGWRDRLRHAHRRRAAALGGHAAAGAGTLSPACLGRRALFRLGQRAAGVEAAVVRAARTTWPRGARATAHCNSMKYCRRLQHSQ